MPYEQQRYSLIIKDIGVIAAVTRRGDAGLER
jgi:hypothetical protein